MQYVLIVAPDQASRYQLAERVAAGARPPAVGADTLSALRAAVRETDLRWLEPERREGFLEAAILKWASAFAGQRYAGGGPGAPILEGDGTPAEVLKAIEPLDGLEGTAVLCTSAAAEAMRGRPDVVEVRLDRSSGTGASGAGLSIAAASQALDSVPLAAAAAIRVLRSGLASAHD